MPPLPEDEDANDPLSPKPRRSWLAAAFGRSDRSEVNGAETRTPEEQLDLERGRAMRLRIREFETLRVGDVMIPRAEVSAVDINMTMGDLISAFAENTVSRMPVYRETLDDPVGFIHLKDIIAEISKGGLDMESRPIDRLKREILFVPPSMRIHDLLVRMQTSRMHIALVVDEYGGTDGLVTLEDLVEQIVGDIEDEHDEEEAKLLVNRGRGIWDVDARAEIEDFAEEAGVDLSLPDYEDEIDTIGGLAFAIAGRVPQRGELIKHPSGVDIEIVEADGRRIRRLRLRLPSAAKRVESVAEAAKADRSPEKE